MISFMKKTYVLKREVNESLKESRIKIMKYFQKLLISLKKAKYKNKKKKNKQLIEMNECVEHLKLERNNFKNGN